VHVNPNCSHVTIKADIVRAHVVHHEHDIPIARIARRRKLV
jgi:hypothetical protein